MKKMVLLFLLTAFSTSPLLAQGSGELIITELMPDPDDVGDSAGEYFELFNDTDGDLNLSGLTFTDDGGNAFTVNEDVTAPADGFVVLCISEDASANGGVSCAYDYPNGFSLNQSTESITLTDASGAVLFAVGYDDSNAFGPGVALELQDVSLGQDGTAGQGDYQAAASPVNDADENDDGDLDQGSPGTAGTTQIAGSQAGPTVQFTAAGTAADEGAGTTTLTVSLSTPDGSAVSVDVAFDADASTAEAADVDGYVAQTVSFPANAQDGATQSVTVALTDDMEAEGAETAVFALQNLQTEGAASMTSPSQFDLEIEDNDAAPLAALVINELLADPATDDDATSEVEGDANGDGTRDSGQDEFVELANTSEQPIDLSGYTLTDEAGDAYTFPDGAQVQPGEAAVVFGGGTPTGIPGSFVGTGLPSLANGGDGLTLADASGTALASIGYGGEGEPDATLDQSITRAPEFTGAFAQHSEISPSGAAFSPGARADDGEPLPVELAGFTGVSDGDAAVLSWQTASETNNDGFYVEQQRGAEWVVLGFRKGFDTTTEAHSYRFRVDGLVPGAYAFRLRQVDRDGAERFSYSVDVTVAGAFGLSAAMPNPFRHATRFTLSVERPEQVTVALYNVLGQRMATLFEGEAQPGGELIRVESAALRSGVYFCRAEGERFSETRRMVLVR